MPTTQGQRLLLPLQQRSDVSVTTKMKAIVSEHRQEKSSITPSRKISPLQAAEY